jgi:hypothetical protein
MYLVFDEDDLLAFQGPLVPTVISAHFWPAIPPTKLRLPGQLER